MSHGVNYDGSPVGQGRDSGPGIEAPVAWWVPSIATSGLAFYEGDVFPDWEGDAFVGGLAGTRLERVSLDGAEARETLALPAPRGMRIRDVRAGPDGLIYLLVDERGAPLLRVEPTGDEG